MKSIEESKVDFTQENFERLLKIATNAYRLSTVSDFDANQHSGVWRHDVDCSPQRALALGKIENSLSVKATYYFNPRCDFYNLFEPAVEKVVFALAKMGHEIGLHFDASNSDIGDIGELEFALDKEKKLIEGFFGFRIRSFSFHNPSDQTNSYSRLFYAGMLNAYSPDFMSQFQYCSDSNGYWRYIPLEDFLNAKHPKICVLTHPEWWTEAVMSPRDRISRCTDGRANSTLATYDALLKKHGRKNVR